MNLNSALNFFGHGVPRAGSPDKAPIVASMLVGFVGSLCCGGGVVFGAIGLGAAYSALGMARFIPEALATGAILITLLNWLYYAQKAKVALMTDISCDCKSLRRTALWSAFFGLAMMSASFVILEWLNHSVVRAGHSARGFDLAGTVISGVPDIHLLYLALTFLALPIVAILPFPSSAKARS
jgi:hypothetical protein